MIPWNHCLHHIVRGAAFILENDSEDELFSVAVRPLSLDPVDVPDELDLMDEGAAYLLRFELENLGRWPIEAHRIREYLALSTDSGIYPAVADNEFISDSDFARES